MCGIAGWVHLKQDISIYPNILDNMSETLKWRGPDENGTYISNHALFAHRRLAVIDPEGGSQPMEVEKYGSSYVIVYNGELYNTNELRDMLVSYGHHFRSRSDTEVLLRAFIEWGEKSIEFFNGIYAFAIWDNANQILFMGRDHFGVKPLFYTIQDDSIIFGSELRTLLAHPYIRPEITAEGLGEIFCLGPSRTPGNGIYRDVSELKPAHYLKFSSKGMVIKQYWKLSSQPHEDSFDITVEKVRFLVTDAIKRQLVSDVPLCTFLSGGLDSSIITAVAAGHFKENFNKQLNTFSIDYEGNEKYFKSSRFQPDADPPWVKRMSDEFNTNHHYIKFNSMEVTNALTDAVEARSLPGMADIDSSLLLFCREIKKDFTVSLSGECADEVFGGYPWFHRHELLYLKSFPWIRTPEEKYSVLNPEIIDFIKPDLYIQRRYLETIKDTPYLSGESELEDKRREMFYLNFYWFMASLLERKDRMSMGTGLEVRVPFCDYRLIQYVYNIPWEMKMLNGREKGLLRKAVEEILPNDVLNRKKSPYPKTHNPEYEQLVKERLTDIINDPASPLRSIVNIPSLKELMLKDSDYGKPWFGQLMARPQLYAYLIQVNHWLETFKVEII